MNIDNLNSNMVLPFCLKHSKINKNEMKTRFLLSPYLKNNIEAYITVEFNNEENIEYNPVELIKFFNSLEYCEVTYWDDNKEFDFSIADRIQFVFKVSYDFLKSFFYKYKLNLEFEFNSEQLLKNIISMHKKEFEDALSNSFLSKLYEDLPLIR